MGRKQQKEIQLDGPLFADTEEREFNAAVNEGLEAAGDEAASVLAGFISSSGFVKTGAFLRSAESELRAKSGQIGYVKIGVTDAWPEENRPTRTWYETGTRDGKKLRKGLGGFAKTRRRVDDFAYDEMQAAIQKALN